jgi:N-methylhydantoinase A/oxoprolinase/acetone carboxylase beta subunit
MMAIALGIDTGGTYTDAVLMDYETNRVLAHAKALTTKYNLAIGIRQAIAEVLALVPAEICLVSLSTTLATNAIVEGHGASVCTLLIGYDLVFDSHTDLAAALGTKHYALISGGHEANGEERFPLDLPAASKIILEQTPYVAGFAVSSYFGTRNPAHEIAIRELVTQLSGKPVTCGHELSSQLDAMRRAVTATLNASLIPLLCDLITAVQNTLDEWGITAPLMVVKGDGSLVSASFASERPIETILSGPAASVVGAQHLGGGGNVVVVDMGGTTTDIAILKDGRPRLNLNGAQVGRWQTMVEAIDVQTVGLGGDSRVTIDFEGELQIGPRRVVPLSLLALQYPQVLATLQEQAERTRLGPTSGEFLILQRADWVQEAEQPPFVSELLDALQRGPQSVEWVNKLVRHPELYARFLEHMERIGALARSGFTPSDAAHCLGLYSVWNTQAAQLGASILAKRLQVPMHELCQTVRARTSQRIASEIVAKLLHDDGVDCHQNVLGDALIARALNPQQTQHVQCSLTLTSGIVAIGAPVQTYFPAVAEMLHCQVQIPSFADVANAIGAVVGGVVMAVRLLVEPQADQAGYRVHTPEEVYYAADLDSAFQFAEKRGRELASTLAQRAGASDIRLQVQRSDHRAPVAEGWGDDMYIGSEFTVTAIGRPRLAAT